MDKQIRDFTTQHELISYLTLIWGIVNPKLIKALETIPREAFLPPNYNANVLTNNCVVMPGGYTLSDPGLVAYMVQQLELKPTDKVLDIGSGSGYHAILMSALCKEVYGVEINNEAFENSVRVKQTLNVKNVNFCNADGFMGWREHAPFDAINFACGASELPIEVFKQLKIGGKIIMPVIVSERPLDEIPQQLVLAVKVSEEFDEFSEDKFKHALKTTTLRDVRFMPMTSPRIT